jgi:hypothetical protein
VRGLARAVGEARSRSSTALICSPALRDGSYDRALGYSASVLVSVTIRGFRGTSRSVMPNGERVICPAVGLNPCGAFVRSNREGPGRLLSR